MVDCPVPRLCAGDALDRREQLLPRDAEGAGVDEAVRLTWEAGAVRGAEHGQREQARDCQACGCRGGGVEGPVAAVKERGGSVGDGGLEDYSVAQAL